LNGSRWLREARGIGSPTDLHAASASRPPGWCCRSLLRGRAVGDHIGAPRVCRCLKACGFANGERVVVICSGAWWRLSVSFSPSQPASTAQANPSGTAMTYATMKLAHWMLRTLIIAMHRSPICQKHSLSSPTVHPPLRTYRLGPEPTRIDLSASDRKSTKPRQGGDGPGAGALPWRSPMGPP